MKRRNQTLDMFSPAAILPEAPSARTSPAEWKGPGTHPHDYHPDLQAMGDCTVCGHTYASHRSEPETGPKPR